MHLCDLPHFAVASSLRVHLRTRPDLGARLRDIETDCRDHLHDPAPPNRGPLNSTHIHGANAPVEDPSAASRAEDASASYELRQTNLSQMVALSSHKNLSPGIFNLFESCFLAHRCS